MGRFGDGLVIDQDVTQAAHRAAAKALGMVDGQPDLVMVHVCTDEPELVGPAVARVRKQLQDPDRVTVIGCATEGVVGAGRGVELEPAVSVWAARLPGVRLRPFRLDARREDDAISILGMPELLPDDRVAVLLADPYTFPIDGFVEHSRVAIGDLPIVGGLATGMTGAASSRLIVDDVVYQRGAIGVLLGGAASMTVAVSQGCRPVGPLMTVTAADRNVLLELAGRAASERLQEVLSQATAEDRALAAAGLHIGIAMNEYGDRHELGDFVVRDVLGTSQRDGGLTVGDAVTVGRTVRFHVRDAISAADDLVRVLEPVRERPGFDTIGGALLFTCNGRGSAFFGNSDHDAREVRTLLGTRAVAGFFASGEIGPVGNRTYVHGFTASILAFAEPAVAAVR